MGLWPHYYVTSIAPLLMCLLLCIPASPHLTALPYATSLCYRLWLPHHHLITALLLPCHIYTVACLLPMHMLPTLCQ